MTFYMQKYPIDMKQFIDYTPILLWENLSFINIVAVS